jgi:hypothetical protein
MAADRALAVPLNVIQRQLGHANLGITSIYLQGIDNSEIINTVHARPAPAPRQRRVALTVVVQSGSAGQPRPCFRFCLEPAARWASSSPPRVVRGGCGLRIAG